MSKKQKNLDAQVVENEEVKAQETTAKSDKKQVQNSKDKKKKKDKEKKGGLVKKTKETVSELKKVTWPTFGEVVKKTGIVIAFVLIFGLFIYGVNTLLGWLVGLLVG
ncbi:MAG: preprotein translocase subunit SecE [Clostridia bacterium]|nr:preprotein translocase subunit SecE [Clostridia bacterium]